MKIIQTFWSKPFNYKSLDPNARNKGGWVHEKYFYYSIALSCLKFKEFYDNVELYTDDTGKKILIDFLQIPYTKIHYLPEKFKGIDTRLWALPKLYAYSIQEEPFIHADNDVYIWNKFTAELENSPIISQNIEDDFPIYSEIISTYFQHLDYYPAEIVNSLYKNKRAIALCAGIFGGNNYEFFKLLKKKAVDFIEKNKNVYDKIELGSFNILFEQLLAHSIIEKRDYKYNTLFKDVDPNFNILLDFHLAGIKRNYIHTIGYAKKSLPACEQVEALLMYEYPNFYNELNKRNSEFKIWEEEFTISQNRKDFLFKIYSWTRSNEIEKIYSTNFHLNPNVKFFEEGDKTFIEFIKPQDLRVSKIELEDWSLMLLYFQESLSINQLSQELMMDEDISNKYSLEELKEKVLSFVFDSCVYHEILLPEFM